MYGGAENAGPENAGPRMKIASSASAVSILMHKTLYNISRWPLPMPAVVHGSILTIITSRVG